MNKLGQFGALRGHSRSLAMSPFDRAHMTSYSTLIENVHLNSWLCDRRQSMIKISNLDNKSYWRCILHRVLLHPPFRHSEPAGVK